MRERFIIATSTEMEQLGAALGRQLRRGDVVVLNGPLGAGKTTLVRGLARELSVRGQISSPTFVIARTHPSTIGGAALIHADAYRLGSALELDDLDLDFAASVTVIEWGGEFASAIAESWLEIDITRPRGAGRTEEAPALDGEVAAPREVTLRTVGTSFNDRDFAHPFTTPA